jgi:hypothetical protein
MDRATSTIRLVSGRAIAPQIAAAIFPLWQARPGNSMSRLISPDFARSSRRLTNVWCRAS